MRTLLSIVILAMSVSCGASLGASFQKAPPPSDPMKSLVYIYRPKKFAAGKFAVQVAVAQGDKSWLIPLNNGAYIPYVADAGQLVLVAQHATGSGRIDLNVQPQKEYYVRITVDGVTVKEMSPADGAAQIRETHYEPGAAHPKRVQ